MDIGITGASGLVGTALTAHLERGGHRVVPFVRRAPRDGEIGWDPAAGRLDVDDLRDLDAVVHLAGAGIGDRRWSDDYKRTILDSRVQGTTLVARRMAELADGPRILLSASAIGIYGDRGDDELDESSTPGDGFLADVCRAWEASTAPAEAAGVRVVHLRTGIVLSPVGGALAKMLPLFKLGLGGRFGNGKQWMSWISITDHLRAVTHLLNSGLHGAVNLTAPEPVRNREFVDVLGEVLGRPTLLPVPAFGPKLLLGSELAEVLLFEGQRVRPAALLGDGFGFDHDGLAAALRAVLDR